MAEFGYRMASSKTFRRYIVKRIERRPGEQLELETEDYNYWVCVTNDHLADPATLEAEHRHKGLSSHCTSYARSDRLFRLSIFF